MTEYHFRKSGKYTFEAVTEESQAFLDRCKLGADILVNAKRPRYYKYHKKIYALVKFAFNNVPMKGAEYKGEMIYPSFDGFRRDLIIKSGFYDVEVNSITQQLRLKAHSISYAKCSQDKAEKIYSAMLDWIAKELYNSSLSPEELEKLSEKYLEFI